MCVQGRYIMWGWLQERRKVGSYDYAGCLSLPRMLYLCGNRLIQVRGRLPPPLSACIKTLFGTAGLAGLRSHFRRSRHSLSFYC